VGSSFEALKEQSEAQQATIADLLVRLSSLERSSFISSISTLCLYSPISPSVPQDVCAIIHHLLLPPSTISAPHLSRTSTGSSSGSSSSAHLRRGLDRSVPLPPLQIPTPQVTTRSSPRPSRRYNPMRQTCRPSSRRQRIRMRILRVLQEAEGSLGTKW
jgi:hypothetical protein